jgi:glutathione synthase
MRIGFVVNARHEPSAQQTTTLLISAALRRGHEVLVCGVGDLSLHDDGRLFALGSTPTESDPADLVLQLSSDEGSRQSLDDYDLCIVRTNPGRDQSRRAHHVAALRLLESLDERRVRVINSPRGLSRALTKLSLLELPASLRPRTLVTRDPAAIEQFLEQESARVVIKPLEGTRGRDVFVLEPAGSGANVKQIIDVVLRQGYAMVQEFVPGAERGDVRVTVVGGEIVELDGRAAAVARVPCPSDFRSNLHAGGTAQPVEVTALMREAVAQIAPYLEREGLIHVGVDFVGGRILELNVFSPGGLYPSERLYLRDFSETVIEAFERRA